MAVSRGHLRADLGMVISIFFVMLALSVIFLVCVEIALLLDCRVPHVMYIVQFRDVLLDSEWAIKRRSRAGPCLYRPDIDHVSGNDRLRALLRAPELRNEWILNP